MEEESYHSACVKLCAYLIWFSQQSYETDNLIPILQMKKWSFFPSFSSLLMVTQL